MRPIIVHTTWATSFLLGPDCTRTETLKFFKSGQLVRTSVPSVVLDENSSEERIVQQSLTLPDGTSVIITAEARKISPAKAE